MQMEVMSIALDNQYRVYQAYDFFSEKLHFIICIYI